MVYDTRLFRRLHAIQLRFWGQFPPDTLARFVQRIPTQGLVKDKVCVNSALH